MDTASHDRSMPIRPQEAALLEVAGDLAAADVLCNTAGRGQFARRYAAQHTNARVVCWCLDLYQRDEAQGAATAEPANSSVSFVCQPDPPEETFSLAAFALSQSGEAELARDMLQSAHQRLAIGGTLVAATDNRQDKWLAEQMEVLFPKVERRVTQQGAVYLGSKREPLRRVRHFDCEFPCRDGDRLLQLRTRPGVFSHRRVDPGARALMAVMEPRSGERVLDIGCGSGVVGLAAAARAENVRVQAIDSNARAIEATCWAAEHNQLPQLEALLDADGRTVADGQFDLALANPPYYSNFRIADLFVTTATRALRTGGQLLVVTKQPDWYFERLQADFRNLEALEIKRYIVVRARRRVR